MAAGLCLLCAGRLRGQAALLSDKQNSIASLRAELEVATAARDGASRAEAQVPLYTALPAVLAAAEAGGACVRCALFRWCVPM